MPKRDDTAGKGRFATLRRRFKEWFEPVWEGVMQMIMPPRCIVCGCALVSGERFFCTACRYRIPLTGFWLNDDNAMAEHVRQYIPVRHAAAMFYFVEGSNWRSFVHKIKYNDKWAYARKAGYWFGAEIERGGLFGDVDVIIPVPLHWIKQMRRGYNQSEHLAAGLSGALRLPCDFRAVRRLRNNPSQTQQHQEQRWNNVEGIFAVRHPERLRGRHILLVDDVFTTGATIVSCARAILDACGGDVEISIATLAISGRFFNES